MTTPVITSPANAVATNGPIQFGEEPAILKPDTWVQTPRNDHFDLAPASPLTLTQSPRRPSLTQFDPYQKLLTIISQKLGLSREVLDERQTPLAYYHPLELEAVIKTSSQLVSGALPLPEKLGKNDSDVRDGLSFLRIMGLNWQEITTLIPRAEYLYRDYSSLVYKDPDPDITFGYEWVKLDNNTTATSDPAFHEAMQIAPGHIVLDPLTGTGRQILPLTIRYPQTHLLGFDLNPENIRKALENAESIGIPHTNIAFAQHDAFKTIPLADNSVDRIMLNGWSTFGFDKKTILSFYMQLMRVLKPGGRIWVDIFPYGGLESESDLDLLGTLAKLTGITLKPIPLQGNTIPDEQAIAFEMITKPATIDFNLISPLLGKRILVVDDQQCILDTLVPRLKSWGLQVTSTTSSMEAQNYLRNQTFDLLMTDLKMPNVDGISLINNVLKLHRLPPTLIFSGSQGNRQATVTFSDMGLLQLEGMDLPIIYMKKEPENLATELKRRLELLVTKKFSPTPELQEKMGKATPLLRSILAVEADETSPKLLKETRKEVFETLVDQFCDLRFSFFARVNELFETLSKLTAVAPQNIIDEYKKSRMGWDTIEKPQRLDLMGISRGDSHDYVSAAISYANILDVIQDTLKSISDETIKTEIENLYEIGMALANAWRHIHLIRFLSDKQRYPTPVAQSIRADVPNTVKRLGLGNKAAVDIEIEEGIEKLVLNLPPILSEVVIQLTKNALQASPDGAPPPVLKSHVVDRTDGQHLYISVVNQGKTIPPEDIKRMLGDAYFTTKTHGTGTGLTTIRESVSEVGGWLVVKSEQGVTEIGVMIPLKGNLPENVATPQPDTKSRLATEEIGATDVTNMPAELTDETLTPDESSIVETNETAGGGGSGTGGRGPFFHKPEQAMIMGAFGGLPLASGVPGLVIR